MASAEAQDQAPDLVEAPSQAKLVELITAGNLQYGLKNYDAAAELYSTATEMQVELNGEMDPKNAELLFRYGRCLFELARKNSEVLGGKVAGEKKPEKKAKKVAGNGDGSSAPEAQAEEILDAKVEEMEKSVPAPMAQNQPFFQLLDDDDDFDDADDEDGDGGEAEDVEDDFATAFEILDIARVLLQKQLEAAKANAAITNGGGVHKGKDKATAPATLETDPELRNIIEQLADTHDLQAEISLENESFHEAVTDFRSALALRQQIYPQESQLLAEMHYKLSLALEFASVTAVREAQAQESADGGAAGARQEEAAAPQVDEELRKEALEQMEAAIESCKLRVAKEVSELEASDTAARAKKEADIQDVKEMIEQMNERVVDLRGPALAGTTGPAGALDGSNPLNGILGELLGESTAQQKARIEEATKTANDLTGLVRKKNLAPPAPTAEATQVNGKGKRKLEESDSGADLEGKRPKTEEVV